MASYIALLRKDPRSDYGVEFPDFPGCITAGRTLEEARRMAAEALAFHVDAMREDADVIPPPSPMDAIMPDPHNRDAIALLVDLPAKSRRVGSGCGEPLHLPCRRPARTAEATAKV